MKKIELTAFQRSCLEQIVFRLEKNRQNNHAKLKPISILKTYNDPFGDIDVKEQLNYEMLALEEAGFIHVLMRNEIITGISGSRENLEIYCQVLGIEKAENVHQEVLTLIDSLYNKCTVADRYLDYMKGKTSLTRQDIERIQDTVKILEYLYSDHEEILERELSQKLLCNTKKIEQEYRDIITKNIIKYDSVCSDMIYEGMEDNEKQIVIWEYFGVYRSPTYIYIQGEGEIRLKDGRTSPIFPDFPMSISSQMLGYIEKISFKSTDTLITIENLAAFARMPCNGKAKLFLSGYHNQSKQKFLMKIANDNPQIMNWEHSGDIDPDGFRIISILKKRTGLPFVPYMMSVDILRKYSNYGQPLRKSDRITAETLKAFPEYENIVKEMLVLNKKLEQEYVVFSEVIECAQ